MENRYLAPIALLFVSLTLASCGLTGSDSESGLKIEYEARHLTYANDRLWQPGDSMQVEVDVNGEMIKKDVGRSSTLSGSFRVERNRGETADISAYIPSREEWNAELEVSWGEQRETDQGYNTPGSIGPFPPSISVPLNE